MPNQALDDKMTPPASAPPPDPLALLAKEIADLQTRYETLQNKVKLTHLRQQIEQASGEVKKVAATLAALRGRGYTAHKNLDADAQALTRQWEQTQVAANKQLDEQAPALAAALQPLETRLLMLVAASTNPTLAQPMVAVVKTTLEGTEKRLKTLEETIAAQLKGPAEQVKALAGRLGEVEALLQLFTAATFRLQAGEAPLAAERAVWYRHGEKKADDDPTGYIFLTTQRLLFEQNEKVATKKFLFVTTAAEQVQRLLLDVPLAQIRRITPHDKGFLGLSEQLELTFEGAAVASAYFQLGADNVKWQQWIENAAAGRETA